MSANVLNSWKEIASYVGRGVRTVQRWEQELGFPVRRPRGKQRSAVIAIKSEIDSWLQTSHGDAAPSKDEIPPWTPMRISKPLFENATTLTPCYSSLKRELKRAIAIDSALKATCESHTAQTLKTDALRNELRLRLDSLRKEIRRARALAKTLHTSTANGNGNGASLNPGLVQNRKLLLSGGGISESVPGAINDRA